MRVLRDFKCVQNAEINMEMFSDTRGKTSVVVESGELNAGES
jgi:hypothetical protein